jgi:RimJ/RimL family protein N-acetyltransferase
MTVCLRRTTEADLDFVLKAEQDVENSPFVIKWTREQHQAILFSADAAHFVVEKVDNGVKVGYLIMRGLIDDNSSIELRRLVITEKNKGYGRTVMALAKYLAFGEWGAHRLWLDVKEHNYRARHLYESEGFVVEGVLRETIKKESGFESLVLMSILRHEYEKHDRLRTDHAY